MSSAAEVIAEVGERLRAGVPAVAAGAGLAGLPGLQGWCRSSVEDFVRHSGAEGRENESVGVFLVEPVSIVPARGGLGREVVWKARYLALENEAVALGLGKRSFSVSPEQIEKVWKAAEARQEMFFRPLAGLPLIGKRYHPLVGLGHTHPGGAIGASTQDLQAFADWSRMQTDLASAGGVGSGRLVVTAHFVYSFGGLTDTLISLDAEGSISASWQGDFQAAVQ